MTNETSLTSDVRPLTSELVKPEPRQSLITIRRGEMDDYEFIDKLQKMHTKMVGWMPNSQLKNYINNGDVLVATRGMARLGYVISRDTYHKHEDIGIIYQVNVLPDRQRGLIGASLVREVFHRAPYGVKLYCCWCAQDLDANYFWESLGFLPIAFRTGSARKKGEERIHIFWQRRVREGDESTPYWFPSVTGGGAIREDRLVLPIHPNTHWSDAKPVVIPGVPMLEEGDGGQETGNGGQKKTRSRRKKARKTKEVSEEKKWRERQAARGGLSFDPADAPPPEVNAPEDEIAHCDHDVEDESKQKRTRRKKQRQKFNSEYIAAARELRDRFLEQAQDDPRMLGGIRDQYASGKYEIGRDVSQAPSVGQLPGVKSSEAAHEVRALETDVVDADVMEDRKAA